MYLPTTERRTGTVRCQWRCLPLRSQVEPRTMIATSQFSSFLQLVELGSLSLLWQGIVYCHWLWQGIVYCHWWWHQLPSSLGAVCASPVYCWHCSRLSWERIELPPCPSSCNPDDKQKSNQPQYGQLGEEFMPAK